MIDTKDRVQRSCTRQYPSTYKFTGVSERDVSSITKSMHEVQRLKPEQGSFASSFEYIVTSTGHAAGQASVYMFVGTAQHALLQLLSYLLPFFLQFMHTIS